MNHSLWFFSVFVLLTLGLTALLGRKNDTTAAFYTANGQIRGWQNGLALAGDYLSAAAFLGAAGMYFSQGYDSLAYAVGTLAGWPLLLLLMAGKLRASGCYTMASVLHQRFDCSQLRLMSGLSSLIVSLFYLIVQMVGAGKLIELLFGLPYMLSVSLVGILMVCYVGLGGMLATTWVQMIKAVLLFICAILLAWGVLDHFASSPAALFSAVEKLRGSEVFLPSAALSNPIEMLSLGLGLCLGLLGLPHVLMRFFTVRDEAAARQSVCWATGLIALFFVLNIVIGYGAIVLLPAEPAFYQANGQLLGGTNMVVVHLARLLGGVTAQTMVAVVAFATILAVVAGLLMAAASAVSHDLYAMWWWRKQVTQQQELKVSRWATLVLSLLALVLSGLFQHQNIAFLFGLAFAMAASANFPVLLLALHWSGLTDRGAYWGGMVGMLSAVGLIITGPGVWVGVLGNTQAWFPYAHPALFSVPLAFFAAYMGSVLTRPKSKGV